MSGPKSSRRSIVSLVVLLIVAALVGFVLMNRQMLYDYLTASQYDPTVSEQSIKDKLNLTRLGSLYYDASLPKLQSADAFNKDCAQQYETNNPVLGCYANNRIFIYEIKNEQLAGIEETTAAHELLHAAYQRLSAGERIDIDKAVGAAYERLKTPELETRVAYYDKTEPGQRYNELYAILGTEFRNLGPTLENHYSLFFNDRQAVVDYYDRYSSVFREVTTELSTLVETINAQTADVNSAINDYNAQIKQLDADVREFNQTNTEGGFGTQAEFESAQAPLVSKQDELSKMRQSIQASIKKINQYRNSYNELTNKYNELNKSINSTLSPTPSLAT